MTVACATGEEFTLTVRTVPFGRSSLRSSDSAAFLVAPYWVQRQYSTSPNGVTPLIAGPLTSALRNVLELCERAGLLKIAITPPASRIAITENFIRRLI